MAETLTHEVDEGGRTARVGELIDAVLARFAAGRWEEDVVRAREEWLERAGRVYDDEASYELRLGGFQEWYALHRPLEGGAAPVMRYLAEERSRLTEEDAACLGALARAQWSLYRVIGVHAGALTLSDILLGGRFNVLLGGDAPGFDAGDLFEARVIGWGGGLRFTRSFLFHPQETGAAVERFVDEARRSGKDRESILFELAHVRLRCDRYRNIPAQKIYEQALFAIRSPVSRERRR